jgi:Cu(I)/Ag(I) efflux system membrane fusion protein
MTTAAEGSMQNRLPQASFNIWRGDYIKQNEVVFKLVNTDESMGCFQCDARTRRFDKINPTHSVSSELDENDFYKRSKFLWETQFSETIETNEDSVYLNNNNPEILIGLRLQGIVETNPTQEFGFSKH